MGLGFAIGIGFGIFVLGDSKGRDEWPVSPLVSAWLFAVRDWEYISLSVPHKSPLLPHLRFLLHTNCKLAINIFTQLLPHRQIRTNISRLLNRLLPSFQRRSPLSRFLVLGCNSFDAEIFHFPDFDGVEDIFEAVEEMTFDDLGYYIHDEYSRG